MRKKQITSPTKISVKQSPIMAKFGPQEIIVSDTSLKAVEDNDDSNGANSFKWQKNNKISQQKQSLEAASKKGQSPQSIEYNAGWKSMAMSPRDKAAIENDQSKKNWKSVSAEEARAPSNQLGINNIKGSKKGQNQVVEEEVAAENYMGITPNYIGIIPEITEDEGGELVQRQHTFSNGDVYIGTWRGKWIEGYGVYNFSKQNLQYRGQFKKSKQHGAGVLLRKAGGGQTRDEQIYDGEWANGEKHGLGKYFYFKDVYYDGNWVRNKKEGHGIFKSLEGEYVGQWKNDKKDGKGVLKLKNGHIFDGIWIMNEFLEGTLTHSNGDRYEGEFQNFNRHGSGTYFYSNKSKYVGLWDSNQKHGKSEINYYNGDSYRGPMNRNIRQGYDAKYRWQTGEEIIAEFQNDMPVKGKIRLPNQGELEFNLLKTT